MYTQDGKIQTMILTLEMDIWVVDCLWNLLLDTLSVPSRVTTNSPSGMASTVTRMSPLPMSNVVLLLAVSGPETVTRATSPMVIDDGPFLPSTESIRVAGWPGVSRGEKWRSKVRGRKSDLYVCVCKDHESFPIYIGMFVECVLLGCVMCQTSPLAVCL